jgi:electron transport complex protein RnfB
MPGGPEQALAERIDAWLPQTQCTLCGYPRCRAYAEALARGEADINRCPPGGEVTIAALAELLAVTPKALDPSCGEHRARTVAFINEADCIGCTLCIQACPVDAILGAAKLMHTVINHECIGCELCVAPCPVECIEMLPYRYSGSRDGWPWPDYSREHVQRARQRTQARFARLTQRRRAPRQRGAAVLASPVPTQSEMRREIAAAIERVHAKKAKRRVRGRAQR